MLCITWGLLVVAAVGTDPPAVPVDAAPPPAVGPGTHLPPPPPLSDVLSAPCGGPPACAPFEDRNGPLLKGDPLLDGACGPPPGFFLTLESGIFKPHVMGRLAENVNVGGAFIDSVRLPNAPLDWNGDARLEIGYRFPEAFGEVIVSYRSLEAEGNALIPNFDILGDAVLHSRLDMNVIDLDYGQHECSLGPCWDMKWRVGVRLASIYSDNVAAGLLLEQTSSSHFFGAGPHAGLELWRHLGDTGLSLYSRCEAAGLWGQTGQNYGEAIGPPADGIGGVSRVSKTEGVPTVNFEAGLAWQPCRGRGMRVAFGYEIEGWWYLADNDFGGRGDLGVQGFFLRGEWGY